MSSWSSPKRRRLRSPPSPFVPLPSPPAPSWSYSSISAVNHNLSNGASRFTISALFLDLIPISQATPTSTLPCPSPLPRPKRSPVRIRRHPPKRASPHSDPFPSPSASCSVVPSTTCRSVPIFSPSASDSPSKFFFLFPPRLTIFLPLCYCRPVPFGNISFRFTVRDPSFSRSRLVPRMAVPPHILYAAVRRLYGLPWH